MPVRVSAVVFGDLQGGAQVVCQLTADSTGGGIAPCRPIGNGEIGRSAFLSLFDHGAHSLDGLRRFRPEIAADFIEAELADAE